MNEKHARLLLLDEWEESNACSVGHYFVNYSICQFRCILIQWFWNVLFVIQKRKSQWPCDLHSNGITQHPWACFIILALHEPKGCLGPDGSEYPCYNVMFRHLPGIICVSRELDQHLLPYNVDWPQQCLVLMITGCRTVAHELDLYYL